MFDLDQEYFKTFLTSCNADEILFCGNWGDPIYSKNFVGLVQSIKQHNPKVKIFIHTNGSGKSSEFWQQLIASLNGNDTLFFSIDGTPENFNLYRINAQWPDVENAVKSSVEQKRKMSSAPKIVWKHIVFSFNQNTILESYKLSKELGFDDFVLQQSIVDDHPWLAVNGNFSQIVNEFNEQKNKAIL